MKKLTNKLNAIANKAITTAKNTFKSRKAEGYVDTGVKILISVVIGALILGGLYTLFGDVIMPTVTTKITELFSYAG